MATTKTEGSNCCFPWISKWKESRNLLLVAVTVTLLLDYTLLTTIVSIMPEYLYNLEHPDQPLGEPPRNLETASTTTPNTSQSNRIPDFYSTIQDHSDSIENLTSNFSAMSRELQRETVLIGVMFAAKPLLQIISNLFVGPLTHMIGYSIPMFVGWIILLTTTLSFAFGNSYAILLAARSIQGIGSSCTAVAGMGVLAERFKGENERGTAISIAFSGICVGVLIGPPIGGIMYQFVGYSSPFLLISALMLCSGTLLCIALPPAVTVSEMEAPSLKSLVTDPYIIIAAGIITVGNISFGVIEPSLPLWMIDTMQAARWEQGSIFLSSSATYLIGATVVGRLGHIIGRWKIAFAGLVLLAVCMIVIPFAKVMLSLIPPIACFGLAVGLIENSMMLELAHLVDIRHTPVYGTIFAIGNFAISLSYVLGPGLSAALVSNIGFKYTLFGIAALALLVAPLLFLLRDPPTREETKLLLNGNSTQSIPSLNIEDGR